MDRVAGEERLTRIGRLLKALLISAVESGTSTLPVLLHENDLARTVLLDANSVFLSVTAGI